MAFKDIPGYEGRYSINEHGEVYSYYLDGIKSQHLGKRGYYVTDLSLNGVRKNCKVHRLVALTFLENPNKLPFVNHIDSNRLNNNISNLEWCTPLENVQHCIKAGRQVKPYETSSHLDFAKVLTIHTFARHSISNTKLGVELGCSQPTVCLIKNGKRWPHYFKYSLINNLQN